VKEALMHARLSERPETSDFTKSTRGVFFFGTPHYGSDWTKTHTALLSLRGWFTNSTVDIAKLLGTNSPYLDSLQSNFAKFRHTITAFYFFEELGARLPLGSARVTVCSYYEPELLDIDVTQVVSRESAVPDNDQSVEMLHKDHIEMVKFASNTDDDYRKVAHHLQTLVASFQAGNSSFSQISLSTTGASAQPMTSGNHDTAFPPI
jgi:hypothetical protein